MRTGIDFFRLIAALLIVAVHTSPLASFSGTGDFILTRVTARTAVPFFFMTSGYFLISRYACGTAKLGAFLKKTAFLYGAAILLYLPVNVYNGYFRQENFLPNLIKDLVFDGTLYHLWYLPAAMTGAAVSWYLVKRLGYAKALAAASALYLAGLFGDSYYGAAEKIPVMKAFYEAVFQVSDYTRNGIFLAPVFFILGGFAADKRERIGFRTSVCGFGISFALMLLEALALRGLHLQRHDSMYVLLPPCMYFLFQAVVQFRGKRRPRLAFFTMVLYIIHPLMIVAVRLSAKLFHLQGLLVENSLVHYLAVCLASSAFAAAAAALQGRYKKKEFQDDTARAYIEIDLDSLEHNVKVLKSAMPQDCELMAVVKTQAYGHGDYPICVHLDKIGIRAFAVAAIDEGIRLRKYGIRGEILVLGCTDVRLAPQLRKYGLTQSLISYEYADALDKEGVGVKAHIKIDTGMHRLGLPAEGLREIKKVFTVKESRGQPINGVL